MFLLFVVFILVSCIYIWHRNAMTRNRHKNLPPMYPGVWPILGHSPMFLSYGDVTHLWNLTRKSSEIVTKHGGIMTVYMGESLYFFVTDPNYCAKIANECPDKDVLYDYGKPWLGNGLLTGSGEVWKVHRKLLNPAFSQQMVNSFIGIFNAQSEQLVNDLEAEVGKESFNHAPYFIGMTLNAIYQTAVGINSEEYDLKTKETYLNNVRDLCDIMTTRLLSVLLQSDLIYKWSWLKKRQDISVKLMTDTFNEIMTNKKGAVKTKDSKTELKYKAFMDLLLEYAAEGTFSEKDVSDELNTILVTGHETTAVSLAHMLIFLGSHPAVQEKLYEELQEVFGNSFREVDKNDLTKLVYLKAVIKESLRLCPIAPIFLRNITREVKLENFTLPAGSGCALIIHGMHRHPVWGADVEQFRPERWFEPSTPPNNAYSGFGSGKLNCIGKAYAMMLMKIVLAHVIRRYRITADVTKVTYKMDVVLRPHMNYFISIDKRNK